MSTSDGTLRTASIHFADALEQQLVERYGVVISNDDLRQVLGYPSMGAFRQAYKRRTIGIPVFPFPNRRGKYAMTKDIAEWLAEQRNLAASKLQQSTEPRPS